MVTLVCNLTTERSYIESEKRPCSKCNAECWCSPASCEHLDANPETRILCAPCYAKDSATRPGPTVYGILPGTADELAAAARPKERN